MLEEEEETRALVLVTGGGGFIAGHLIQQLLLKGYRVRATVRSLVDSTPYEHLLTLTNADRNLEIVAADLVAESPWPLTLGQDISHVFHIAAPFILRPEDPGDTLIKPTVGGMTRVLELCQGCKNVEKLILTSCIQALSDEFDPEKVYDESSWNTLSSMGRNTYAYSKTEQEKLAWDFTLKEPNCHFKLISILPGLVLGPHLNIKRISQSHKFLLAFISNNRPVKRIPNINFSITDVRDVANAHIVAMEKEGVEGRYCFCHEAMHLASVLQIIHENFVDITIPTKGIKDIIVRLTIARDRSHVGEFLSYNLNRPAKIDCKKALQANMVLRPVSRTVIDTVRYLLEGDFLGERAEGGGCSIS